MTELELALLVAALLFALPLPKRTVESFAAALLSTLPLPRRTVELFADAGVRMESSMSTCTPATHVTLKAQANTVVKAQTSAVVCVSCVGALNTRQGGGVALNGWRDGGGGGGGAQFESAAA